MIECVSWWGERIFVAPHPLLVQAAVEAGFLPRRRSEEIRVPTPRLVEKGRNVGFTMTDLAQEVFRERQRRPVDPRSVLKGVMG